jgi:hypothetical protein
MFSALFALMGAVGAWYAWRRNPSYSTKSTLRLLLILALSIGGVVLLIVGAVKFSEHRSMTFTMVTLAVTIVFSTLAMIFIIQAASTPKSAQLSTSLPASSIVLHVFRRRMLRQLKVFGILLAACALPALIVPGPVRYVSLSMGGMVLFLACILVPLMYWTARKFDRALTNLEATPWVHWKYSPEQWAAWVQVQTGRLQAKPPTFIWKRDWHKLAWPFAAIAIGVIFFSPGSLFWRVSYVLFCCGMILGLVFLSKKFENVAPEKYRAKLSKADPEAYFGPDGIYCDGAFTTWLGVDVYLLAASIDGRAPRSLMFDFEKVIFNPYGNSILAIHQSVLLPDGAEADLSRLQHELTARCPKARITLA